MNTVFTKIRFRILAIVLLAIIPAILLIFYSAAERKLQVSRDIETNSLRLCRILAGNLQRDMAEGQGYLKVAALLLQSRSDSAGICGEDLSVFLGDSSIYLNFGIADSAGNVLCSAAPLPGSESLRQLDWFGRVGTTNRFTVGFDFQGILSPEATLNLALPIKREENGSGPVIFSVMDLNWLNRLAENARLPQGSALAVTNNRGDAVARYPDPDKWVGKAYPLSRIFGDDPAPEGIRIGTGVDGVERVYAHAQAPGKGNLRVHVGIRKEAVHAPADNALMNQLFALGVVSVLAILAAWFLSDIFLLKQVRALIAATRNLAKGNLTARSSLSYDKGELGDLARAFDEMAETLQWREAQLKESEIERAKIGQAGRTQTHDVMPGEEAA